MTNISDIVDTAELELEIAAGYINRRFHPDFPSLALVGYSDRAQFDNHWTPTVRACRGLIYNSEAGEVLARPFAKFFNYGQETGVQYDLDARIVGAYDKLDGSLGIGYIAPDLTVRIATRGSFESEQSEHATAWYRNNIDAWVSTRIATDLILGLTPLVEIIYPENRIVLDYGRRDELVYLGAVRNDDGMFFPAVANLAESNPHTLREVLELPDRPNAEGWVVWLDHTTAVKIKQEDYLALHRIVSSLTVKEVWRQLRAGTYDAFAEALPDEFHDWARDASEALIAKAAEIHDEALDHLRNVLGANLPDRKSQALWVQDAVPAKMRSLVFALLDYRDIAPKIWAMIEPRGAEPASLGLAA